MTNYSDEPSPGSSATDLPDTRDSALATGEGAGLRPAGDTPTATPTTTSSAGHSADDMRAAMPIAKRTRVSSLWVGAVLAALLLILLLVFILQNGDKVQVNFLWLTGHLPLGVALLFAAVGGVLLMGAVTGARVIQLRLAAHRVEKAAR